MKSLLVAPISGVLTLILVTAGETPILADTVRLRNGGVIEADSWRYEDDLLVVRQKNGTIVIPRREIVRIDPSLPLTGSAPGPAAAPEMTAVAEAGSLPDGDLHRVAGEIRRQIQDYPLARAENTRRLVSVLSRMAAAAFRERRFDAALTSLREAQGLAPHEHDIQEGLAATHMALGQDRQARAVLDRAMLDHPESPDLLTLVGDLHYGQERPGEALAAWQKAYALRPDPSLQARILKLQREQAVEGDYRLAEAVHFTLRYDGERTGPDLETAILDYLEGEFWNLARRFDYEPPQPIVVIVYPQRQFHEATLAQANVAGLYDGKIRVPIGGLHRLNDEARQVLIHELAHAFVAGKTGFTAPRWLQEGIAQMVEGLTTQAGSGEALARAYRGLDDKSRWGKEFSYPAALSFVEFVVNREGFYRLVDILEAMGRGANVETAFREATRSTLAELHESWGRSLEVRHLH